MDKEQWKNEILNSLHGLKRAEPNPFLFTRIEAALAKQVEWVTPRQWKMAAVFGLVLLALNGWFAFKGTSTTGQNPPSAYQLNTHRYELY